MHTGPGNPCRGRTLEDTLRITSRKSLFGSLAVVGAVALLAGCASAPTATTETSAKSDFLPCIVSDVSGFNDHSFNQLALAGVTTAAEKIGSKSIKVQSKTENDYASNIASLIAQKCNLIVAAGFNLVAAVKTAATANPTTNFAMIDDNSMTLANVKSVVYETNEAAFLGGYAAASYSKSGVVATYGGAKYPSVTLYMDGFVDGVKYFNKQKSKNVQVLGWNVETQNGTFVGGFTDQGLSNTITKNFLDQKADVIVVVSGNLYQGAAAAIKASGGDAVLEGVDADVYNTDPANKSIMLTSIMKNLEPSVKAVIEQAAGSKTFDNSAYVGDLKNNGVGIAPFHDFESKVTPSLADELAKIKAGIIDGSIKTSSPSSLKK